MKQGSKKKIMIIVAAVAVVIAAAVCIGRAGDTPQKLLVQYMTYIEEQDYESMYQMIEAEISQEDFVQRNSAIYEGIEASNIEVEVTESDKESVTYRMTMDTIAGTLTIDNQAQFVKKDGSWKLLWEDSLIFPQLTSTDKVRISTTKAVRGDITDRNGKTLATMGRAASIGIVPGKLENKEQAVEQMAEILGMEQETIEKKLSAKWVMDDTFVPIKTIPIDDERCAKLISIQGVMINNEDVRYYPLGEAAAHLVGYVQQVTAEDLEEHAGEGYSSDSLIGRTGMESLYEKRLKGTDGCRIYIRDQYGHEKAEIARVEVQDGEDIKLTIDSQVQKALYQGYQEDKSCSVAMDPSTGEVLALVSTPSYDNNDFVLGLSDDQWTQLNEAEDMPLYNRFRQVWCPGSVIKPIMAAAGLEAGTIEPEKNYGNEGLKWQKDASWGDYYVTTLHAYEPDILENALIYSDNIYFAKAALRIGAENLQTSLDALGFGQEVPFEIKMTASQYSNEGDIDDEIQLADTGYGQGQMLVNPLHIACLYTAFYNKGNVADPYLEYGKKSEKYWISEAFSEKTASVILEDLKKVINDKNGTGHAAYRSDITLAGKTGTAEIKATQSDTTGTELGWFAVMTADDSAADPLLIVTMVEDVKNRGGSTYVVKKTKTILDDLL